MTEFEIFKAAFEKRGDKINITIWKVWDGALITNETEKADFWFKGGRLERVENF